MNIKKYLIKILKHEVFKLFLILVISAHAFAESDLPKCIEEKGYCKGEEKRGGTEYKWVYKGEFFNGKRHGQGIITYECPYSCRQGYFINEHLHEITIHNITIFEGEFKNGARSKGTLTNYLTNYNNTKKLLISKLVGESNYIEHSGKGVFIKYHYDSEEKYNGETKYEGSLDIYGWRKLGDGIEITTDKFSKVIQKYVGKWSFDKKKKGIQTSPTRTYEGEWDGENMHGEGVFISEDLTRTEGVWMNNILIAKKSPERIKNNEKMTKLACKLDIKFNNDTKKRLVILNVFQGNNYLIIVPEEEDIPEFFPNVQFNNHYKYSENNSNKYNYKIINIGREFIANEATIFKQKINIDRIKGGIQYEVFFESILIANATGQCEKFEGKTKF